MIEEWKSYTRYQKIVLCIYTLISLPLMPLYVVMIPLSFWITKSKGDTRKLSLVEFLSLSVAMSMFAYLTILLLRK
jgi:hypothetical protein